MLRLKYYTDVPNVGDEFSLALAMQRFGGSIAPAGEAPLEEPNLLFGGSILHWADARSVVCGTGFIASALRPFAPPAYITSVRGPLTAEALRTLGIKCPAAYGDPGVLAAKLFPPEAPPDLTLGIVPHYVDVDAFWIEQCRSLGIAVLDVRQPLDEFLHALCRCEVVLSSSLHGLVFAHAYRRPALWIEVSSLVHGDGFKFYDYYASIGVSTENVVRCRISATSDPRELAQLATPADSLALIPRLEDAIAEAASLLIAE